MTSYGQVFTKCLENVSLLKYYVFSGLIWENIGNYYPCDINTLLSGHVRNTTEKRFLKCEWINSRESHKIWIKQSISKTRTFVNRVHKVAAQEVLGHYKRK